MNLIAKFKSYSKYSVSLFSVNFTGCVAYLAIFYLMIKPENWVDIASPIISVLACLTNLACLILLAKKKISNFYYGATAVVFFMFISWITNNYGSFILNFYYLIMNILSIFVWKKSIGKDTNKEITSLSLKKTNFILIIIGAVVISVGIMFILTIDSVLHFFGDTSYAKNEIFWIKHYLNSLALTISIIAMLFATLHIRQQWVMWMVSNGATISMWIINIIQFSDEGNTKMLLTSSFTLFTYLFSCVNSVFGYMNWKKLNLAS